MSSVLEVRDLSKSYGPTPAVDSISFQVKAREIVGLLGPNGAGKTTTINMVLGVLAPSAGSIAIEGIDLQKQRARAMERTNFAAVYAQVPGNLTVRQNLRVFGMIYAVNDLKARIEQLLEKFDLRQLGNTKCGVLSSGEQTRVALAKAMLNEPHLLLLDEPTASLDPATAREIRTRIRDYVNTGVSGVLWTSHNMYEVEEVCDRVLFLSRGRILLEGDPKTLPGEYGRSTLEELFITVAREPLTLELEWMYFGRTAAIVLRQYYLMRGSVARITPLFAWVAIDIVLWGFITRYLNSVTSGVNFVPSLLGAVLLWDFFARVMQGVSMGFLEDVWSRNFLNLFASPLRISEYLGGLVLTSIATSTIGLLVMLVLATGVFGLPFFAYGLTIVPFLLVLFLFGIALGIVAIGLVLRMGPAAEWFVWPIPALISPFAGVFYPVSTLPGWMQIISRILPPSYVFEGLRGLVQGEPPNLSALGVGLGLAMGYILIAATFFKSVFQRAVRTGLIARYSAETLS